MPARQTKHRTRPRWCARAALVMALLTLTGCFGPSHRELADEAFVAQRYETAVKHYQAALANRSSLNEDPHFVAQFNRAKVLAHIDRAQRRVKIGDHLNAVDELDKALAIDPTHSGAALLRRQAATGAAELLYQQAINQADLGDKQQAAEAINRALSYQPAHLGALRARDALAGKPSVSPEAQQAFEQGLRQVDEKRWAQAIEGFDRAVAKDASLLNARLARHEAEQPIRAANGLFEQAVELEKQKRLDATIAKIEQAKSLRPHHTGYDQRLGALLKTRNEVERWLAEAVAAMHQSQWDQGLVLARRARGAFPYHPRLDEVERDLRTSAARHYTTSATTHHAAGRLDRADTDYRKALAYAPNHGPAKRGLANTATTRANAAEHNGRMGQALLWHTQALQQANDTNTHAAIARLRSAIQGNLAIGLSFDTTRAGANGTAWDLQTRVVRRLRSDAPSFVHIDPQPGRTLARLYIATVDAGVSQARVERTHRSTDKHAFRVEREALNPRIDDLKDGVYAANHALDELRDKREDLLRRLRRAEHWLREDPGNPAKQANIDRLHRHLRANRHDIVDANRHLRHVEHRLSCEPLYVTVRATEYWPYTIETYRKSVELTGRVIVRDTHTNRKLEAVSVRQGFSEEDKTLIGANPQIGLGDDPLAFTDDAEITRQLLDRAADETVGRVLNRTIRGEVTALRAEAKAQAAAGNHAGALESRVAAAVLLEHADAKAAATYLEGLRKVETGP